MHETREVRLVHIKVARVGEAMNMDVFTTARVLPWKPVPEVQTRPQTDVS